MKRLLAMLLTIALLISASGCAGGEADSDKKDKRPKIKNPIKPTVQETLPTETEGTEPDASTKVTVYLLEKTVFFDSGHQLYTYDENYNIVKTETFSLENDLLYITHFSKQDENGMFCESAEEWDGESQYRKFVWSQDGKLQEEQYDPGYSGNQYEYDATGNVIQIRNYYNGNLNYTTYYEYTDNVLQNVYCENVEGCTLFESMVKSGRVVDKDLYDTEGTMYCAYEFLYAENGNLETRLISIDGEASIDETYTYRTVEVEPERVPYLLAQQQYLLGIPLVFEQPEETKPEQPQQADASQPMDLVGTWVRTQTEVDGDVQESPAGQVIVRITGSEEGDLRIDYEDTQSAYRSFDDRAIFIMPGEDFMGVGEVEWIGQINFTGESANDSYMLVLVDGELIMRHIFTVDGTPCASYEIFRRLN